MLVNLANYNTSRAPVYQRNNPNLINSFDNVQLNGKLLNKVKAAVKKVSDKIGDTKVMQKVKSTKAVQKVQTAWKNAPKPLKAVVKVLAAPLAPTMVATGATVGATALTTAITTKAAALPIKLVKKAAAKAKAKKIAAAEKSEAEFQKQMEDIQNGVIEENTIPVSARTDAGNVAAVQAAQNAAGQPVTPAYYTEPATAQAEPAKPADNNLLKYGVPIGLAALALFSNS